jgi:hypothetical protein
MENTMPDNDNHDRPGPTDDFPEGKLNEEDEGGLMMAISIESGNVRIDFGKPIAWFAIPPDQALALASVIVGRAMEIKARGGKYQL